MGITSTASLRCRSSSQLHELTSHNSTPLFTSKHNCDFKSLTQFRGNLLPEECVYTFKTLIIEYFQIFKRNQNIVISDYLCKVNTQGDLFVFCSSNPCYSQSKLKSYVEIICKIFQIVCDLCISEDWVSYGEGRQLKQAIKMHILKLYNYEQLLYSKIIYQSDKYLRNKNFIGNLLEAVIRSKSKKVECLLNSQTLRRRSNTFNPILSDSEKFSQNSLKQTYAYSNPNSFLKQKNNRSNFYPNTPVKFQISQNSFARQSDSQNGNSFNESIIIHKKQNKRKEKKSEKLAISNKSYISPQFSINILAVKYQPKEQKNCSFPSRRITHRMTSGYIFEGSDKQSIKRSTNKTAVNFNKTLQYNKQSHSKVKSVLDTMARLVQVKQNTSSKSFIY